MLASQWFTFIQDLISALQSTCDASSSTHTQQVNVKLANLGTNNYIVAAVWISRQAAKLTTETGLTIRPLAYFGSGLLQLVPKLLT